MINLYEADYNLSMGLKWRAATLQAEALKLLHSGQFGSRPNRNATDPVFIKEIVRYWPLCTCYGGTVTWYA